MCTDLFVRLGVPLSTVYSAVVDDLLLRIAIDSFTVERAQ